MRRFLLLISLTLVAGVPCAVGEPGRTTVGELRRITVGEPSRTTVASAGSAADVFPVTEPVEVTDPKAPFLFPFNDNETVRYTVAITFKSASFSGICVAKRMDGVFAGSIVNEFGIRAFDFTMTSDRRRVRLLNVMKPLDKCLIRKTIARDLKRLFNSSAADEYVSVDGDKVIMRRPNRSYTFSKMNIPE